MWSTFSSATALSTANVVALGVNDIGTAGRSASQVLEDLQTIADKLKG